MDATGPATTSVNIDDERAHTNHRSPLSSAELIIRRRQSRDERFRNNFHLSRPSRARRPGIVECSSTDLSRKRTHTRTRTCTVRRVFVQKIYIFLFIVKIDLSVNFPPPTTTTAIITYVHIVFYGSASEYRVVYRPGVPFGLTRRRIFSGEKCEKYLTIHSLVRARDYRTRLKHILPVSQRNITGEWVYIRFFIKMGGGLAFITRIKNRNLLIRYRLNVIKKKTIYIERGK